MSVAKQMEEILKEYETPKKVRPGRYNRFKRFNRERKKVILKSA